MTTINKRLLQDLRPEIGAALATVAEKHGIKLTLGNATYDSYSFKYQLQGAVLETENGQSAAQAEYDRYSSLFGLKDVPFGLEFERQGRTGMRHFKIVGLSVKAKKYPLLCEDLNTGGIFKLPASAGKQAARDAA